MDNSGKQVDQEDGDKTSLIELYKLDYNQDADARHWAKILDLDSPIKAESDWHSTKTFRMFLDALDIDQPSNPGRSPAKRADREPSSNHLKPGNKLNNETNRIEQDRISKEEDSGKMKKSSETNKHLETILSAEALKILSELPDISHMSSTKSFIFRH